MISETAVMERLRAANPASAAALEAPELWLEIVRSPGDPRLEAAPARARRPRGWGQRGRVRRAAVVACGVLVAACGTAALAKVTGVIDPFAFLSHDKPLVLFRAAPGYDPRRQPAVVPSSVRLVETVSVPGVGRVEYWTARTVTGWACAAFKLPNGEWAGTTLRGSDRYGFGGPVPSCHGPWITWEGPDFHYDAIWLGANHTPYGLLYGTVRTADTAAEVRDLPSGAATRVVGGGDFVLIIPARMLLDRNSPGGVLPGEPRNARHYRIPYVDLEALDARGRVLTVAPVDHITFGP
jgi:hypothetical protein